MRPAPGSIISVVQEVDLLFIVLYCCTEIHLDQVSTIVLALSEVNSIVLCMGGLGGPGQAGGMPWFGQDRTGLQLQPCWFSPPSHPFVWVR